MDFPSFSEFVASIDLEKVEYDISRFAPNELNKKTDLFTEEQYAFIAKTISTMQLTLLAQYHQWLNEQIVK